MDHHQIKSCRSCGADIIWFQNPRTDKWMPVDAETVEPDDEELDLKHMTSHFATCPDADDWRQDNE
jgi:hypothetical protein